MSKSLLYIIKEANKEFRENPNKFADIYELTNHYKPFYEMVKDKVENFNVFESICFCDMNFDFQLGEANDVKEVENLSIKEDIGREGIDDGVKCLKDFTPEQIEYIDKAKELQPILSVKPSKKFDNYGLRHSMEHLNTIGGSIILLPLEDMTEYVDVVTKSFVDADETFWIISQYNDLIDKYTDEGMNRFNATSIGNFAYIAMYCKHKPSVEVAMIILNKYYDFLMFQMINLNKENGDIDYSLN